MNKDITLLEGKYLNWKEIALDMNRAKGNAPVPITGAKGRFSTSLMNPLAILFCGILAKVISNASSTALLAISVGIFLPAAKCAVTSFIPSRSFICLCTLLVNTPVRKN